MGIMGKKGAAEPTPLMKQYWALKEEAGDALLLFRMGDFYELFGDDAVIASRVLGITLTSRDKNKDNALPMAGVPHHSIRNYLQKLLDSGYRVGLGEQMEDPSQTKGIVRREITRIFTPAVQFESEAVEPNFLAVTVPNGKGWTFAALDPSTGLCLTGDGDDALGETVSALTVKHFLYFPVGKTRISAPESLLEEYRRREGTLVEEIPANSCSPAQARDLLNDHYGVSQLGAFFGDNDSAVRAMGLLVQYALRSQKQQRLAHLRPPLPLRRPQTLTLGPRTPQHLDLFPTADGTPNLFSLVDRTTTALGSRTLRRWLAEPLRCPKAIEERQHAVGQLSNLPSAKNPRSLLKEVYDLERILGRVNTGLANPRDTLALGKSVGILEGLMEFLENFSKAALLTGIRDRLKILERPLTPLARRILETQRDDAPLIARDGKIFRKGVSEDLDHLIELNENGQQWLLDLEARERQATGIPSLKVRYNKVFGYYIEITKTHLKNVPDHYQRKQSMVNAERFFTEELKKFEEEIVTASAKQKALEQDLFEKLLEAIRNETQSLMELADHLAHLDCLSTLGILAEDSGWTFPQIDESKDLEILQGRHPVVDQTSGGGFVPNDLFLSPSKRLSLLITGPNMGGKSTLMRQIALIVVLGQMGAPVPAEKARWGTFHSLYTRIGAHDAIARGQSTFMVEMSELAHILHHANDRSLLILDEIGRGTSTYDGISVASASLEWIAKKIGARTLFATHYHELTQLAQSLPLAQNAHMAVDGGRGKAFRFLYELRDGPTSESYGVQVAQLAGMPAAVVRRAQNTLRDLEEKSRAAAEGGYDPHQLNLFGNASSESFSEPEPEIAEPEPRDHPVLLQLEEANVDEMTPVQALNFLALIKKEASDALSS